MACKLKDTKDRDGVAERTVDTLERGGLHKELSENPSRRGENQAGLSESSGLNVCLEPPQKHRIPFSELPLCCLHRQGQRKDCIDVFPSPKRIHASDSIYIKRMDTSVYPNDTTERAETSGEDREDRC